MLRERVLVSKYSRIINSLALRDKDIRGLPSPQHFLHLLVHVYQYLKKYPSVQLSKLMWVKLFPPWKESCLNTNTLWEGEQRDSSLSEKIISSKGWFPWGLDERAPENWGPTKDRRMAGWSGEEKHSGTSGVSEGRRGKLCIVHKWAHKGEASYFPKMRFTKVSSSIYT